MPHGLGVRVPPRAEFEEPDEKSGFFIASKTFAKRGKPHIFSCTRGASANPQAGPSGFPSEIILNFV